MSTQSSKTLCFERGNAGFSPATKRSNEDLFIRKVHFRPDDSNDDFYEEEEEEEEEVDELDCNTIDIGEEEEEDDDDELEVTVTKFDFLISQQQQQSQPPMKSSNVVNGGGCGGGSGEVSADLSLVSNAYSPGGSSSSFSSYSTTTTPALAALSLYINSTTATTSHLQITTNTTSQLDCEKSNQIESNNKNNKATTELSCHAKSNRQHRDKQHSVSSESSSSSLSPTNTSEHSSGSPSSSSLGTPPLLKLDAIEAHLNESASYLNIFSPIPENEPVEQPIIDKQQDFEAQRSEHLFTPDSLESSCSISSSLSDLSTKLLPNNQQQEEDEDDQQYFVQQATQLPAQSIEEDLKADAEICQINHESTGGGDEQPALLLVTKPASETSLILDKIKRINQLQEKINDINNKIKSIDMTSHSAIGSSTQTRLIGSGINPSYYCLQKHEPYEEEEEEEEEEVMKHQAASTGELIDEDSIGHFVNPKYCGDDDEEDEDDDLSQEDPRQTEYNQHKQDYRSLHNQTRMCIRKQGFQEANNNNNNQIFENLNHNLMYGNSSQCRRLDDDEDDDEEEDDNENEEQHLKYMKNCYTNEFGEHDYIEYRHGKLIDEDDRVGDELDDDEDDESFEDEDEDEDMFHNGGYGRAGGGVYKQAQPVHKKYASTGFLFHRFGGYLAPIEECQEEPPATYEPAFNFKSFVSCYSLIESTKCGAVAANSSYSPASLVNKAGTSTNQFSSHIEASQCADVHSPPYPGQGESWKGEFCWLIKEIWFDCAPSKILLRLYKFS